MTVTFNDLAAAATDTYSPFTSDISPMGEGRTKLSVDPDIAAEDAASGFFGEAWVNSSTGEVIIAGRGTTASAQNFVSDGTLGLIIVPGAQNLANDFALRAVR